MALQQIHERERLYIEKFYTAVQLPNYFKKIGWGLLITTFLAFFAIKAWVEDPEFLRVIARKVFLIAMLIIALSKEKIEDEMIVQVRAKAYSISFIFGVIYAVFQPFVEYFIAKIFSRNAGSFIDMADMGTFQLLIFMLMIYIGFFSVLKRNC